MARQILKTSLLFGILPFTGMTKQGKWLLLLLLLAVTNGVSAQTARQFSVTNFGLDQFDLTAQNEQYKKMDGSGSLYAIIKVSASSADDNLSEYRFNFGNMNHEVVQKDDKLWVYVQRNAKYVTISRKGFATIERYDLGTTIEAGRTYTMTLSAAPQIVNYQMVLFSVSPADCKAMVTVKSTASNATEDVVGITDESGNVAKNLPFNSYTYRVMAEGYYPTEGHFTLNDKSQTHRENVMLRSRYATVTLQVDANADIYVNGEKKGTRSWTGRLNSGSYQVECRQQSHRPSIQSITVAENEDKTFTLTAPTPITGILSVMSQPLEAIIMIDGTQKGTSPCNIADLLIGRHTIVAKKNGYEDATQTVDIVENETTNLNLSLKKSTIANGGSTAVSPSVSGSDRTFTVKGVSFVMKAVAGGTFRMGSDDSDAYSNEKPVHSVTLSSYMMGETEVTQELWQAVMGGNPVNFKEAKRPQVIVSWDNCQTFIQKLNDLTGQRFRLPTEAEWEFAARGGNQSKGYKYAGSNSIKGVAWYEGNSDKKTHDVKTKAPNELGLYDMTGNVEEWCQDWYGSYSSTAQTNSTGPSTGSNRVRRGGSWLNNASFCRVSCRDSGVPSGGGVYLGFRLAL